MAITDPRAIAFVERRIRPAADLLAQAYYFAGLVADDWNASGMSALVPNTADVVRDPASPLDDIGSSGDGRPVVTGAMATNIVTRCQELIADREASNKAGLNTLLAVAAKPLPDRR